MKTRAILGLATAAALLSACGGGSDSSTSTSASGGDLKGTTLTYWASNQAGTPELDKKILDTEFAKFEQQTGVKVKVEVQSWNDFYTKLITATTSGVGPDVTNIGNTWSVSLGTTGAFLPIDDKTYTEIGGKDKFVPAALKTAEIPGAQPASVPIYSAVYGLYYNKKLLADAGAQPPKTWQELQDAAKKLTGNGVYGLGFAGTAVANTAHFIYMFGQQNGGTLFDGDKATFTNDGTVNGIKQYLDLFASGSVNPSDAQGDQQKLYSDFANSKIAMMMAPMPETGLSAQGMDQDKYGMVPVPTPDPLPAGGKAVSSFVGGINIAIFKNTKHLAAAKALVKFMTSPEEEETLNKQLSSLPTVKDVPVTFTTDKAKADSYLDILANRSGALPLTPKEAGFENNLGSAVATLAGKVAKSGKAPSADEIKSAAQQAQDKVNAS